MSTAAAVASQELFGKNASEKLHRVLEGVRRSWNRAQVMCRNWTIELEDVKSELRTRRHSSVTRHSLGSSTDDANRGRFLLHRMRELTSLIKTNSCTSGANKYEAYCTRIAPLRLFLILESRIVAAMKDSQSTQQQRMSVVDMCRVLHISSMETLYPLKWEETVHDLKVKHTKINETGAVVVIPTPRPAILERLVSPVQWQSLWLLFQFFEVHGSNGNATLHDAWNAEYLCLRRSANLCACAHNLFTKERATPRLQDTTKCHQCGGQLLNTANAFLACPACGVKEFNLDGQLAAEKERAGNGTGSGGTNGTTAGTTGRTANFAEAQIAKHIEKSISLELEQTAKQRLKRGLRLQCYPSRRPIASSTVRKIWEIEHLPQAKRFTQQLTAWVNSDGLVLDAVHHKEHQAELSKLYEHCRRVAYKVFDMTGKDMTVIRPLAMRKLCLHKVHAGHPDFRQYCRLFPLLKTPATLVKHETMLRPVFEYCDFYYEAE